MTSIRRRRTTRTTSEQRAYWLKRLESSGLSVRTFALQQGLSVGTLARWKWKTGSNDPTPSPQVRAPFFHTLDLGDTSLSHAAADAEISFPNGVRVQLASRCPSAWIGQLLSFLR